MFRRSVAILTCSAVLALLAAPTAQAKDPDLGSYGAGASASALFLSVTDQEFTFSGTSASVGHAPEAHAAGRAVTTPLFSTPGVESSSTGEAVEKEDCVLDEALPAPIDLAGLSVSCARTSAAVADGSPTGTSVSDEIVLEVISAELLGQVSETAVRPALEQLLAGLDPLVVQLGDSGPTLAELIDLLLADLEDGGPIATITVAPTSSTATEVQSLASSNGASIDILPDLLPGVGPLATVSIGDSFASTIYDAAKGVVVTDGEAAPVSVDLSGLEAILSQLIGQLGDAVTSQLPEAPDETLQGVIDQIVAGAEDIVGQILAGVTTVDAQIEDLINSLGDQLACPDNPLAAIVCVTPATLTQLDLAGLERYGFEAFGQGTRGIEASALGVNVLAGTVELAVGQTAAGANGLASLPSVPDAPTSRSLPVTGGEGTTALALALFAAAAVGITIIRRTRSTI